MTPTPRIYLASKSPRRRDLLRQIGVNFDVLTFRAGERGEDADVDETPLPGEAVERYVERLALAKAQAGMRRVLWRKLLPHPVLAADTTLEVDGEIVGKPHDAAEAHAILERLSGRRHRVLTAVAMSDGERTRSRLSVSEVAFRRLSEHDIRRYVATGEPFDKAGAYGIQGHAAIFVEEIRGSYSGIMGLPLFETAALLDIFGHPVL
ncbi:MAG: septum formation inhibitor Maf [Thauera sp.]|uniref:dTTP/UTP pyrophosphatase n=1 Tax=Thauera phenylacetica B4P TaxID=1234382 RepID=N6YTX4_9RHOO|nr:Maf family protein [Thauera phenylacetica]ENO94975.1 maf protein [Thauera phenylacetica B4P]MBP7639978.1 septum formation inhibitor Maf [Thauera sp.]